MQIEGSVENIYPITSRKMKDGSKLYIQKIVIDINDDNTGNEESSQKIVLEQIGDKQINDVNRIEIGKRYLFILGSKAKEYLYDNGLKTVFGRIYMANCYPPEYNFTNSDIVVEGIVEYIYPQTFKEMKDGSELVIQKVLIVLTYGDETGEGLEKREIVLEQVGWRQVNLIENLKIGAKYDFTLRFKANYGKDKSVISIDDRGVESAFGRVYTTNYKLLEINAEIPDFEFE